MSKLSKPIQITLSQAAQREVCLRCTLPACTEATTDDCPLVIEQRKTWKLRDDAAYKRDWHHATLAADPEYWKRRWASKTAEERREIARRNWAQKKAKKAALNGVLQDGRTDEK